MVRAWKLDESRLDSYCMETVEEPKTFVNLNDLKRDTGVLYWQVIFTAYLS